KEVAKKKQLELARQRALLAKEERLRSRMMPSVGDGSPTGFGSDAVVGPYGDDRSPPAAAPSDRFQGGGFTSAAEVHPAAASDDRYEAAFPMGGGPKRGLVLGRKRGQHPGPNSIPPTLGEMMAMNAQPSDQGLDAHPHCILIIVVVVYYFSLEPGGGVHAGGGARMMITAVVSKQKTLLARQFVDIPRLRIE
ncbi:Alpha-1,3-mannosyltransferase-like protein, partial [Perkinsus olseni]